MPLPAPVVTNLQALKIFHYRLRRVLNGGAINIGLPVASNTNLPLQAEPLANLGL